MAEGNQSPPKAEVDDSPLQHAMDRNKECEYKSIIGSDRILISYEHLKKSNCQPDLCFIFKLKILIIYGVIINFKYNFNFNRTLSKISYIDYRLFHKTDERDSF